MRLSLPQDDPNRQARARELETQAKAYAYNREYRDTLWANSLPKGENYDPPYAEKVVEAVTDLLKNRAEQKVSSWPSSKSKIAELLHLGSQSAVEALWKHLDATSGHLPNERPTDVTGYSDLIAATPRPLSLDRADDDAFFAWQQIAGATPITLRGIDRLPDNLPVDATTYSRAVNGADRLNAALAEGRLFLSDYALWDDAVTGKTAGRQKYIRAPLALFARLSDGQLHPVAIQVNQRPGTDNPIWTPSDGVAWKMAKTVVTTADMNVNGVLAHFGYCHCVAEAFICISHRQLSPSHPLLHLLLPHFRYTLAVNATARTSLVNPGGKQETLQSGTLDSNFRILNRKLAELRFDEIGARAEFKARGLDDATRLPTCPFRDDGVPLADALHRWADDYLRVYYADDAAVRSDTELQQWASELAGPGRFGSMPRLDSIAALARFTGDMLWRLTGYHSVINYGGYDFAAWAPGMPSAAFGPGPHAGVTEKDWANMLPPLSVANEMLELMFTLLKIHLNRLGDYPAGHFDDPRVLSALARFRTTLDDIAGDTSVRDAKRPWSFPFLHPSRIPASIHV